MGLYALAASTVSLLAIIDPAMSVGVMRSVARLAGGRDGRADDLRFVHTAHAVFLTLGGAVAVSSVAVGVVVQAGGSAASSDGVGWLILLLGTAFAVQLGSAALMGALLGRNDYSAQAMAALLLGGVSLVVVVATIGHLGLPALGLGELVGMVSGRALIWLRAHRSMPWLALSPRRPSVSGLRQVAAFAVPMLLVSVAGQVMSWLDVVVVGGFAGAAAVAFYRVGSLIPSQLMGVLYRGYDVSFPRLSARGEAWQLRAVTFLSRLFSALAAVGFSALVVLRADVITLLTGRPDRMAEAVIVIFSLTWAANMPAHGLGLLAIARGKQSLLSRIVVVEAAANAGLTVLLAWKMGPVGVALATLVTLGLSNLVAMPLLLEKVVPGCQRLVWRDGVLPLVATGLVAFVLLEPVHRSLHGTGGWAALVSLGLTLVAVAVTVVLGSRGRSLLVSSLRRRVAE